MRPFNKTTATLVRPHPFSTLCPTPLGKSPVCFGFNPDASLVVAFFGLFQARFEGSFVYFLGYKN